MEVVLEQALKLRFPKIKNLEIDCGSDICNVKFDEGDYSKEEVEEFINGLRR